MSTNRNLFCRIGPQNARESTIVRGLQLVSRIFEEFQHSAIQTKKMQAFWRIFLSNKSVSANKKKVFYTSHLPKNEETEAFLHLAAQNFELLSKIKDEKSVNSTGLG
jgi:hypothetical protein